MVKKLLIGGGAVSPSLKAQVFELFPNALIMTAYGMIEDVDSGGQQSVSVGIHVCRLCKLSVVANAK